MLWAGEKSSLTPLGELIALRHPIAGGKEAPYPFPKNPAPCSRACRPRVLAFRVEVSPHCFFDKSNSGFVVPAITRCLTFNEHIKTAEQRTIIQQYNDWYTDR